MFLSTVLQQQLCCMNAQMMGMRQRVMQRGCGGPPAGMCNSWLSEFGRCWMMRTLWAMWRRRRKKRRKGRRRSVGGEESFCPNRPSVRTWKECFFRGFSPMRQWSRSLGRAAAVSHSSLTLLLSLSPAAFMPFIRLCSSQSFRKQTCWFNFWLLQLSGKQRHKSDSETHRSHRRRVTEPPLFSLFFLRDEIISLALSLTVPLIFSPLQPVSCCARFSHLFPPFVPFSHSNTKSCKVEVPRSFT